MKLISGFPDNKVVMIHVKMCLTRALGNGLFEIRAKAEEGIGRVFFCTMVGRKIIILHSFIKKTDKTPKRELDIALTRQKEVISNEL
jgi:phage-related protein